MPKSFYDAVEPPDEEPLPFECPICGTPLNTDEEVYIDATGQVVGCEFCLTRQPAGETWT